MQDVRSACSMQYYGPGPNVVLVRRHMLCVLPFAPDDEKLGWLVQGEGNSIT